MPYLNKKIPNVEPLHILVIDTDVNDEVCHNQYYNEALISAPCDHTVTRVYKYWYDQFTLEGVKDMSFESALDPNANKMQTGEEILEGVLKQIEENHDE